MSTLSFDLESVPSVMCSPKRYYSSSDLSSPWNGYEFDRLEAYVFGSMADEEIKLPGGPFTDEFRNEWQRLRTSTDRGNPCPLARERLTRDLVLAVDDLASSLNIPTTLPKALQAHQVRVSVLFGNASLHCLLSGRCIILPG